MSALATQLSLKTSTGLYTWEVLSQYSEFMNVRGRSSMACIVLAMILPQDMMGLT